MRNDYIITNYGAVGDNLTLNTQAIQHAIDDAALDGGRVVIPKGEFKSGTIFLRSGVELHLEKGAVLSGSQDDADYPDLSIYMHGEQLERTAGLITALYMTDIAITGEGMINGNGKIWWHKFWGEDKKGGIMAEYEKKGIRWAADRAVRRPRSVYFGLCKNIRVEGITMIQGGSWNLHFQFCQNVLVDGVTIRDNDGPSTDGIDIDSTRDVIIRNCDIDCNDDNICFKAGRDMQGIRMAIPTENVLVHDCITRAGHGLFSIGSETAGCIRNLRGYRLKSYGTKYGLRFKSAKNRGGIVENITIEDVYMEGAVHPIRFELNWFPAFSYAVIPEEYKDEIPKNWLKSLEPVPPELGLPTFRNISISDVTIRDCYAALYLEGLPELHAYNVTLKDIDAQSEIAGVIRYMDNLHLKNVKIQAKDGNNEPEITESENLLWE